MSIGFKSISREQSAIMRGLAILAIAAHNMLHCVGYLPENESSFIGDYPLKLWNNIMSGTSGWFGDVISFFGYYGVPVFIFLSGYGLVKKYEKNEGYRLAFKSYFANNYLKLFFLVLPATIFLIGLAVYEGSVKAAAHYVFGLTFLNDFVFNFFPPQPGVYWYFGLTLQLYLIYFLLNRYRDRRVLLWCFIGGFFLLTLCNPSLYGTQNVLRYVRHNAAGWISVFVLGVYWARNENEKVEESKFKIGLVILKFLASAALLVLCCFEFHIWLFTPFFALLATVYLSEMTVCSRFLKAVFVWLGGISSSIFVVHPIVRMFTTPFVRDNPWIGMSIYFSIIIGVAFLYSLLYSWMRRVFFSRFSI